MYSWESKNIHTHAPERERKNSQRGREQRTERGNREQMGGGMGGRRPKRERLWWGGGGGGDERFQGRFERTERGA